MIRFWLALLLSVSSLSKAEAQPPANFAEPAPEMAGKLLPGDDIEKSSQGKLVLLHGKNCENLARRMYAFFVLKGADVSTSAAAIGEHQMIFYHDGVPLVLRLRGKAPTTHADCKEGRANIFNAVADYMKSIGFAKTGG